MRDGGVKSAVGAMVRVFGVVSRWTLLGVGVGTVGGWGFGLLFALLLSLLHGEILGFFLLSLAFLQAGLMAGFLGGLALGLCEVLPPRTPKSRGGRGKTSLLPTEFLETRPTPKTFQLLHTRNY